MTFFFLPMFSGRNETGRLSFRRVSLTPRRTNRCLFVLFLFWFLILDWTGPTGLSRCVEITQWRKQQETGGGIIAHGVSRRIGRFCVYIPQMRVFCIPTFCTTYGNFAVCGIFVNKTTTEQNSCAVLLTGSVSGRTRCWTDPASLTAADCGLPGCGNPPMGLKSERAYAGGGRTLFCRLGKKGIPPLGGGYPAPITSQLFQKWESLYTIQERKRKRNSSYQRWNEIFWEKIKKPKNPSKTIIEVLWSWPVEKERKKRFHKGRRV